jgi:hypothetical protein
MKFWFANKNKIVLTLLNGDKLPPVIELRRKKQVIIYIRSDLT